MHTIDDEGGCVITERMRAYAAASQAYYDTLYRNYYRTDLTRRVPVGGDPGVDIFHVQCAGSNFARIAPCGWREAFEFRPGDAPAMLTPNNACPRCGNFIVTTMVEYGVGAVPSSEWFTVPLPGKEAEVEAMGREQHRLHVAVYEAWKALEAEVT